MNIVPKISVPLAKAVRTSEGILVYLVNLILGLGAVIDPSKLPPSVAAKWAGVIVIAHVATRTLLKVAAVQKNLGVDPPIDPQPLIDKVAAEVAAKTDAGPSIDEVRNLVAEAVARGIKENPVQVTLAPGSLQAVQAPVSPVAPPVA